MAEKKVTYKEPASYFTPSMLKVAKEYDKQQAKAKAAATKKPTKNSAKKK